MAKVVVMPKLGLTMTEGTVSKWLKKVGDPVKPGEPLFDVETDKLTHTIEANAEGVLRHLFVEEGTTVPVLDKVAAELARDIGRQEQLPVFVEVAADIVEAGHVGQLKEAVHAVVKLVAAGHGDLIAELVHQADNSLTLAHRAERFALNGVAGIDEDHIVALVDQVIAQLLQAGEAEAVVDGAVYVTGEEDHGVAAEIDG